MPESERRRSAQNAIAAIRAVCILDWRCDKCCSINVECTAALAMEKIEI